MAAAGRFPLAALAASVLAVASYQGLGFSIQAPFFLPLLFTGYSCGQRAGRWVAALLAAATFACFGLAGLVSGDISAGFFVPVLVLIAIVSGVVVGEYRAAEAAREEGTRHQAAELMLAEERLRIARELHDVVSHSISMIAVQAGAAAHVMDREPDKARESLLAIKAASREALQDLRGILGLLRMEGEGDGRAPAAGLERMSQLLETVERSGVTVSVDTIGSPRSLRPATDLAAYRVLQEALTNVVRHAPGTRAEVRLEYGDSALEISVRNGRPTRPPRLAAGAGLGLKGMQERVVAAGGSLEAGLVPEGGFSVRARLPFENGA